VQGVLQDPYGAFNPFYRVRRVFDLAARNFDVASILDIIIRLNKDAGISFLYITHDLSTAYHIADELVVLLEGETVERGPARTVIDTPQHEYTKLLVDSVPVPDPDVRWTRPSAADEGIPALG
jgi:ABC-type dipeptide/oligopeptide/nickel transport system ATPase component